MTRSEWAQQHAATAEGSAAVRAAACRPTFGAPAAVRWTGVPASGPQDRSAARAARLRASDRTAPERRVETRAHRLAMPLHVDSDERLIELNGVAWENGAPAKEMCCGLKLVRKK